MEFMGLVGNGKSPRSIHNSRLEGHEDMSEPGEDITKRTKYTIISLSFFLSPKSQNSQFRRFVNSLILLFLHKFFKYDYKVQEFKNAILVIVLFVNCLIRFRRYGPVRIPYAHIALCVHLPGAGHGHYLVNSIPFYKTNATYR